MFIRSIIYTVLVIVLVIGGGCGQNEDGHEATFNERGDGTRNMQAEDERCLDDLAMLDKASFEAGVIFSYRPSVFETTIDECLEWIFTGSFVD